MDRLLFWSRSAESRRLSNFYVRDFLLVLKCGTFRFSSAEAAYQCLKQPKLTAAKVRPFQLAAPSAAREYGRSIALRPDWDEVKVAAMAHVLAAKFAVPELRDYLLATDGWELVHWSPWDTFWGVGADGGENRLGLLLMDLRRALLV